MFFPRTDSHKEQKKKRESKIKNLPPVEWTHDARYKNLKWVQIGRTYDEENQPPIIIEDLIVSGWVDDNAGKPFYPLAGYYDSEKRKYAIFNGSHRLAYCKGKGEKKVLIETPTIFIRKEKNHPPHEMKAWNFVEEYLQYNRWLCNIEVREKKARQNYKNGLLQYVKKDGKVIVGEE